MLLSVYVVGSSICVISSIMITCPIYSGYGVSYVTTISPTIVTMGIGISSIIIGLGGVARPIIVAVGEVYRLQNQ